MKAKNGDCSDCYSCIHFSEFKDPRQYDEINFVYGYCFKKSVGMLSGYPVYLPKGTCKNHCAKPKITNRGDEEG